MNRHRDRQRDKQTNIWTFRLIESIGPEGRCFENHNLAYFVDSFFLSQKKAKHHISSLTLTLLRGLRESVLLGGRGGNFFLSTGGRGEGEQGREDWGESWGGKGAKWVLT